MSDLGAVSDERLERLLDWHDGACDEYDGDANEDSATAIRELVDARRELTELRKRIRGYEAWERSVNEALNTGDGSYRP